jgi:hypothetical protein
MEEKGYLDPKKLLKAGICGPGVEGSQCFDGKTLSKAKQYSEMTGDVEFGKKVDKVRNSPNDESQLQLLHDSNLMKALGDEEYIDTLISRFKVPAPHGNKLFSNFNENLILKQLHSAVPSFKDFECVLMDFHNASGELSSIANPDSKFVKSVCAGEILTFGTVPNTLVSSGDTSKVGHWVALFGDFRGEKWTIEYYNSTGTNAPAGMWSWMQKLATVISDTCNHECIAINASNVVSQRGPTECGIYSLHYILCRLIGIDYKEFRKNRIPDGEVNKLRKLFMNEKFVPNHVKNLLRSRMLI